MPHNSEPNAEQTDRQSANAPKTGPATVAEAEERLVRLLARTQARETAAEIKLAREIDQRRYVTAKVRHVEQLSARRFSLSGLRDIRAHAEIELRQLKDNLLYALPEEAPHIEAQIAKKTDFVKRMKKEIADRGADAEAVTPRPADPVSSETLPSHQERIAKPRRRKRAKDTGVVRTHQEIRRFHKVCNGPQLQLQTCKMLDENGILRPPGAAWRDLTWVAAYHNSKYGKNVRKYLSNAVKSS